jgi:cysteine synthase A
MAIYTTIIEAIGNTPLVRLNKISDETGVTVYGKCEFMNPCNSIKDRTALGMIEAAEKAGKLKPGAVILEATSGNTGIGLAFIAAVKGYKVILTMPESMTIERRKLLKAYGVQLELTPAHLGMSGAIERLRELAKTIDNAFVPNQFDNVANPGVHFETTAKEIDADLNGNIDAFIAGVGTGGTLAGVSRYFKSKNKTVQIIAVEPKDSPVLSGGQAGPHMIQGIGAGFVPGNLKSNDFNDIITVSNEAAFEMSRKLAKEEGLILGMSSGANVVAAYNYAKRSENKGKTVVCILCDFGERYLSTTLFD